MSPFQIIIPARYASTRLPGKPLADIGGKPMLQHVVERARESDATAVVVATDDARIAHAVEGFGGEVVMTSVQHASGTDRIAEAVDKLGLADEQIILNLQGDEPGMPAATLNQVVALLVARPDAVVATASAPLDAATQLHDPAVVKVVTDRNGYALYFSRAAIAQGRDAKAAASSARLHLGVYAYRCGFLRKFTQRPPSPLEQYEQLEQLRVLWYGGKIVCAEALEAPLPGIDTAEDLARARRANTR